MSLKIKEAVRVAVDCVSDLFSSQSIRNVLLEEVARDDSGRYLITVGFERPASSRSGTLLGGGIAAMLATERAYKVVCIDQEDGEVISVKDRILEKR